VGPFKGILSIVAAGLLAADMFTDGMNAWDFFKMTLEKNGNITNIFSPSFYRSSPRSEVFDEAIYFYLNVGFMLLPVVVAVISLWIYLQYVYSRDIREHFSCCDNACGTCVGTSSSIILYPLTFILCLVFSVFTVVIGWVVNPILHLFYSFFILFGIKPSGEDKSKVSQVKLMISINQRFLISLMVYLISIDIDISEYCLEEICCLCNVP